MTYEIAFIVISTVNMTMALVNFYLITRMRK